MGTEESWNRTVLLLSVKKRKPFLIMVMCYGKKGNCMEKEIMQGATSGQRAGRPRTLWKDNIIKWTGLTGDRLVRYVEDKSQYRKIIHEVKRPILGSKTAEA